MKTMRVSLKARRSWLGVAFISPWLIGFVLLFATPLIQSIRFGLSRLTVAPGGYSLEFVGLDNIKNALFVDAGFNRVLIDSVGAMLLNVPMILFFSLFTATLLNQKFKGRTAARAIFFLPVILASSAVAAAESAGLINLMGDATAVDSSADGGAAFNVVSIVRMLADVGLPAAYVDYIVEAIMRIYDIISSSGVQILIFLAALQSVPGSMYEVAKIEGATAYESFWKITFPMVSPLILTNVVYTIIDSFSGSPITELIYQTAFKTQNFGLSAAMSWIYTMVIALVLTMVGWVLARRIHYN